jgi:hypothetical protein
MSVTRPTLIFLAAGVLLPVEPLLELLEELELSEPQPAATSAAAARIGTMK